MDLLRIDFTAASRIADPDVEGSMYLDPANLQIRRTYVHLSKPPRQGPDLLETEVTTLFAELLPSIPVISAISSTNRLKPGGRRQHPPIATGEEPRLSPPLF